MGPADGWVGEGVVKVVVGRGRCGGGGGTAKMAGGGRKGGEREGRGEDGHERHWVWEGDQARMEAEVELQVWLPRADAVEVTR